MPLQSIDISPVISPRTAVFPGDTAFSSKVLLDFENGDNLKLSTLTTTPHIGAHTDAPNHYHREGNGIHERNLHTYMGRCQVIEVEVPPGQRIFPHHVLEKVIDAQRVLFKTRSFPDPNSWNDDFNSLSPELVEWLAKKGVRLIGIDTPSVDPANSKELESHNALYKFDVAPLEGIVLDDAPEGIYTLIALPLRIEGLDASPVRAVLLNDLELLRS